MVAFLAKKQCCHCCDLLYELLCNYLIPGLVLFFFCLFVFLWSKACWKTFQFSYKRCGFESKVVPIPEIDKNGMTNSREGLMKLDTIMV